MRLHALQYLRAIAATAVVYSHTAVQVSSYQPYLREFGAFGVDIFFVISGFIMVYIAKPGDTPVRFITSRVRRVVPLYWFFTLLMAAILLLAPFVFKTSVFDIPAVVKSLLFIPHYSLAYPDMVWPIVAPGWSLNFEMYFYMIFAASLLLPGQWRVWIITLIIALVFAIAWIAQSDGAINSFFRDTIVFEFVLGMFLAKVHRQGFQLSKGAAYALLIAGFALLFAQLPFSRIVNFGIPSLMIVAGTVYSQLPQQRFFVLLGDSSYALYLCHIFTLGVCRTVLPPLLGEGRIAALLFVLLALIICIASGIVVHYLIDNWLLKRERLHSLRGVLTGSNVQY